MIRQVSANVYVEDDLDACNLGFVTTKDGIVMIDTPGNALLAVRWRDEINNRGQVRFIINTEEHPDHCSNSWFYTGTLITSQITREKLAKVPPEQVRERAKRADPSILHLMESFQLRLADITFNDTLDLHIGKHTFKLFALPGHSEGGIGVYIPEERVVFATDCVFNQVQSWLQEADPEQWLASLKKLDGLEIDVLVPGHGAMGKKESISEQADIIFKWMGVVKAALKQGLTLEEAINSIKSPDPYPKQQKITFITEEELNKRIITRLYQLFSSKIKNI